MDLRKTISIGFLVLILFSSGCLRYSFTGTSIPEGVNTIYIPFFPDQSNSGLSDLSDRLNQSLINRFVNQSRLQLANDESSADAVLDGTITAYTNRPFSIGGNEQANQNEVTISVRASFKYQTDDEPLWNKPVSGNFTYDPTEDPIGGERDAASEALDQIANKLFNDAVSNW
jgi:hypothetical protein